jgi:hypothetical protein
MPGHETQMPMNRQVTKTILTVAGALLVIAASLTWIFVTQCGSPKYDNTLHQAVGQVIAEETLALIGSNGEVVVLVIEPGKFPTIKAQLASFLKTMKNTEGTKVKVAELKADKPKYDLGSGLSARRLLKEYKKYPHAAAIVSFIGLPNLENLEDRDLSQLKEKTPKLIVEERSVKKLRHAFEKQIVELAIVPRFAFPAPIRTPQTPHEWFDKHFQIVTNAAALPGAEPSGP